MIDPTGSFLYTVNSHSNTVSAFTIAAGGALTLISNPPYATGGKEPVSLSVSPTLLSNGNRVVTVANKDNDPGETGGIPSIQTLAADSTGAMTPVHGGKISFAAGGYLGSVGTTPLSASMYSPSSCWAALRFSTIKFMTAASCNK